MDRRSNSFRSRQSTNKFHKDVVCKTGDVCETVTE
jgi:hypothetical protein